MRMGHFFLFSAVILLACQTGTDRGAPPPSPDIRRTYLVGFLGGGTAFPWHQEFARGMELAGYDQNSRLRIVYRYAEGDADQLQPLAQELVAAGVDAIVTTDTATTEAVRTVTTSVPIVAAVAGDPVLSNLADSMTRPGKNVTGIASRWPELSGKRIELLQHLVPGLRQLAVIYNSSNRSHAADLADTQAFGEQMGIEIVPVGYRDVCDLPHGYDEAIEAGADAAVLLDVPQIAQYRGWVAKLVLSRKVPTMHTRREIVEAGGLVSYTVSLGDLYFRSASFVDKILRGTSVADLPFEQPEQLELTINRRAAATLGLTLSPSVLQRADTIFSSAPEETPPACDSMR